MSLKEDLKRLRAHVEEHHPEALDLLPHEDGITTAKMEGIALTTDTCTTARLTRSIIKDQFLNGNAIEIDCQNHTRNIYLGLGCEKPMSKYLHCVLKESLEEIDPSLRVSMAHLAFARAYDKEFSLCANYPKGHGEEFKGFVMEKFPGVTLFHVANTHGTRQDIIFTSALAMMMNRHVNLAFLNDRLTPDNDNILQLNLFTLLTSDEMVAQTRLLSIFCLSSMMPLRWLAGKTQDLAEYNWGARHYGLCLDIFYKKLKLIQATPTLFLSESFMMGMFSELYDILPPFKEEMVDTYTERESNVVTRQSGARLMQMKQCRDEIFNPKNQTNIDSTPRVLELVEVCVNGILNEMDDKTKVTWKYLSHHLQPESYQYCIQNNCDMLLGFTVTNDIAESVLGGTTKQVQDFSRIDISSGGAVSSLKRNGFFIRPVGRPRKKNSKGELIVPTYGMFHQLDWRISSSIISIGIADAEKTRIKNNLLKKKQLAKKLKRREEQRKKSLADAQKKLQTALYYHRMYDTEGCIKGSVRKVDQVIDRLRSETQQRTVLKNNINIRTKGFGWTEFSITFSTGGKNRPIEELKDWLKKIIKEEKNMKVPSEPPNSAHSRRDCPILGTITDERRQLDKEFFKSDREMRFATARLANERRARREEDSMYHYFQPLLPPKLKSLEGTRIDVLWQMKDKSTGKNDGKEWCQGKVLRVLNARQHLVEIEWDPMPDVEGWEKKVKDEVELDPAKWNMKGAQSWRLDLDVELYENFYQDSEDITLPAGVGNEAYNDVSLDEDNENGNDEVSDSDDEDE